MLNAFRHLICRNPESWRAANPGLGTCSTPFGILYVGTRRVRSARERGRRHVLNAFRHLICRNPLATSQACASSSAQRLSASYMSEPSSGTSITVCARVLNAFRHLICRNGNVPVADADGVGAVLNAFRHLICRNTAIAGLGTAIGTVLNAFRHLICRNWRKAAMETGAQRCSTPFGILYVGTPVVSPAYR